MTTVLTTGFGYCLLAATGFLGLALTLITLALFLRVRALHARLVGVSGAVLAQRLAVKRAMADLQSQGESIESSKCGMRYFSNRISRLEEELRAVDTKPSITPESRKG